MAPGTAPSTTTPGALQLKQNIYYHLDCESIESANFLATRLYALEPRSPDAAHLLALTFLRLRQTRTAYDISQKYGATGKHLGSAYVFALTCHELRKSAEGISALERAKPLWQGRDHYGKHSETSRRHLPDAAAVQNLLAKLWRAHGDLRKAAEAYNEAHRANPFTWDAFQGLCDIGSNINVAHTFRMSSEMAAAAAETAATSVPQAEPTMSSAVMQPTTTHHNVLTPSNDPFNANPKLTTEWNLKSRAKSIFGSPPKIAKTLSWETPTTNGGQNNQDGDMGGMNTGGDKPSAHAPPPVRRTKTMSKLGLDIDKDARLQPPLLKGQSDDALAVSSFSVNQHKRTHSGHVSNAASDPNAPPRRSNRLFHQVTGSKPSSRQQPDPAPFMGSRREVEDPRKAKATGTKGRGLTTVGRVVSGNRKVVPSVLGDGKESRAPSRNGNIAPPIPTTRQVADTTGTAEVAALEQLLDTMRRLGSAYYALSRYETTSAIELLQSLPLAQRETPWVLAQLAKAYYWSADYNSAEIYFARVLKLQPTRMQNVELYSTVLWHLKKQVQLSYLAHTLRDLAFEAPQTWCALGNAFGLNGEDEQAISCFKRATQLDPEFWYGWTLLGHQYLGTGEYDAAMAAFRKGIGRERRIYDGWYGLGHCYEKMGKYDDAERHYRIAASINPGNAILATCIGGILEKSNHTREALAQYSHALTLDPKFALARFKKARALQALCLFDQAILELEELRETHPEEANIFFQLGQCWKELENRTEAVRCFTTAISLDAKTRGPQDAQHIKEAMESLGDTMMEDEDDEA